MTQNEELGLPFDASGMLWTALIAYAERYAEWGAGESTVFAVKNSTCHVRTVDTSIEWLERTRASCGKDSRLELTHVNLGPLLDWGRPSSYRFRAQIDEYLTAPFAGDFRPDLVLIDGRFRVACFLAALLHSEPGTVLVFDDYGNREQYHVVEEILSPVARSGRQAIFVRPSEIDDGAVQSLLSDFKHVMD